jgi:hypothetical protein
MRRLILLVPAALLAALASLTPTAPVASSCAGAGPNHAALVVEHGGGAVIKQCVAFSGASITGEQLLNQSGVSWSSQTFGGYGDAVCALDGEPAHYLDCPGKDSYWAVFVARGGSWQLASLGITALVLHNGDAEGFRYVPAVGTAAAPISGAGVCPTAASPTPRRPPASGTVVAAPATFGTTAATATATGTTVPIETAGATATAAGGKGLLGSTRTEPPSRAPARPGSGGFDIGLLLAAVVGGGLAGLAALRLVAGRRWGS